MVLFMLMIVAVRPNVRGRNGGSASVGVPLVFSSHGFRLLFKPLAQALTGLVFPCDPSYRQIGYEASKHFDDVVYLLLYYS